MSQQVRLDRFEEWFIARKARKLAGRAGFTASDVDDIEQDIRLDVLQRLPRFDPAKSNRHTFIVMLVRRCAASIVERRRAAKRNGGRRLRSLNAAIRDADGDDVELGQALSDDARLPECDDDARDLQADVRRTVATLPAELRRWCQILATMSIREASRKFHVPRCRLHRIRAEIRAAFEAAGLGDYMPDS